MWRFLTIGNMHACVHIMMKLLMTACMSYKVLEEEHRDIANLLNGEHSLLNWLADNNLAYSRLHAWSRDVVKKVKAADKSVKAAAS